MGWVVLILFLLAVGAIVGGVMISRRSDTVTQQRLGQFVGGLSDEDKDDDEGKAQQTTSFLTKTLEQAIESVLNWPELILKSPWPNFGL
jgi:hypothetical protein